MIIISTAVLFTSYDSCAVSPGCTLGGIVLLLDGKKTPLSWHAEINVAGREYKKYYCNSNTEAWSVLVLFLKGYSNQALTLAINVYDRTTFSKVCFCLVASFGSKNLCCITFWACSRIHYLKNLASRFFSDFQWFFQWIFQWILLQHFRQLYTSDLVLTVCRRPLSVPACLCPRVQSPLHTDMVWSTWCKRLKWRPALNSTHL